MKKESDRTDGDRFLRFLLIITLLAAAMIYSPSILPTNLIYYWRVSFVALDDPLLKIYASSVLF
jgi:hypothetical protein